MPIIDPCDNCGTAVLPKYSDAPGGWFCLTCADARGMAIPMMMRVEQTVTNWESFREAREARKREQFAAFLASRGKAA